MKNLYIIHKLIKQRFHSQLRHYLVIQIIKNLECTNYPAKNTFIRIVQNKNVDKF
jgi:hypothetical protein